MKKATGLQIRVDLQDSAPPIWRRLLVPADTTLDQLHLFLQGAFGWTDSHLHGFRQGNRLFTHDPGENESTEDETSVVLGELLVKEEATLIYDYDFGDDWEHTIRLEKKVKLSEKQFADLPRLLDGARACPPEDCGGISGYQQFLKLLEAKDSETLEWASELGGLGEWSAETFDREDHESYMRALGSGTHTSVPAWTPLEEQLAWAKLDSFLSRPEWKATWDEAEQAMRASDSMAMVGVASSEDSIPGFHQLIRDHAAFDLILDETEPVVPELIRAYPDLPEGSQMFLRTMFVEPLAPYLVEQEPTDGLMSLFSLVDKEMLDVQSRPDCKSIKKGDLLLARVIFNGEHSVIRGQCLQSPFNKKEYEELFPHLQMMCRLAGGDPANRLELLKPAPSLFLAFWKTLTSEQKPERLPLSPYRNAAWEPGTSVLVGSADLMEHCIAALNGSPDLLPVSNSLWMFSDPDAAPNAKPPAGFPGIPIAWIMLVPGQLHLLAGSRKALKLCRESLKKMDLPPMRHFKTSYSSDLDLPVFPL